MPDALGRCQAHWDFGAVIAGRFDLGRALEALGDLEGARREWQLVVADAPDFQDVSQRLAGLGQPKPEPAEVAADDGLESFDDMMDGLDDEDFAPAAAEGERFTDLLAEAEADDDEGDAGAELILEAEPLEDDDASDPGPDSVAPEAAGPEAAESGAASRPKPDPAPKRKKKKISFF
jgi:hypothetical protein